MSGDANNHRSHGRGPTPIVPTLALVLDRWPKQDSFPCSTCPYQLLCSIIEVVVHMVYQSVPAFGVSGGGTDGGARCDRISVFPTFRDLPTG